MKPYAVMWDNECGYGTDYFDTEEEQLAFVAACKRRGTCAVPALTRDLHSRT